MVLDKPMAVKLPVTDSGVTHRVVIDEPLKRYREVQVVMDSGFYSYLDSIFPDVDLQLVAFWLVVSRDKKYISFTLNIEQYRIELWRYNKMPEWARIHYTK